MLENPATVIATTGELIVLTAAVGIAAGDLWILPSAKAIGPLQILTDLRLRLWKLLGLCLILFTCANLAELLLHTASVSDLPLREALPQVETVLFKTQYGQLWLWRAAALLTAWFAWGLYRREGLSRVMSYMTFMALTAIAVTLSAAGHAGDDGIFTPVNLANSAHIIGAFLWGGGILATALVIFPMTLKTPEPVRALVAMASLRLSTLAGIALAMVVLPGLYNAWLQINSWQGLWTTLYGQLLVAKVALVATMAALGALNRYRHVPAIQRHAGLPEPRYIVPVPRFVRDCDDAKSIMQFLRNLWEEAALLLGVLILAAALSQQTPAIHAEHADMQAHHGGDGAT